MGLVHAEITLKNTGDVTNVERGLIKESEIRQTTVTAMVDTGAGTLVINEELRKQLGLEVRGLRRVSFANETKEICKITEPVDIHWQERSCAIRATVVPHCSEVLLGAIPLEDMDLIVDPKRQTLIGAHGDEVVCRI